MIHIDQLRLNVGQFALRDISLDIAPGEYFVLLGPSGSGKTLLLESLCGLRQANFGRIVIGGVDVTGLEPRQRQVGYVPQDYALFPHLTVRSNVAFGIRDSAASDGKGRVQRVDELLQTMGLSQLAQRRPAGLSGGEKQRVALARALAVRPQVLLLDEPVSALDESMRDVVCRQLKWLQQRTGTTFIHVCHNFAEMMAVADRVGVIHKGRMLQVGSPDDVLRRPQGRFVAEFVQGGNILPVDARLEGSWLCLTVVEGLVLRSVRDLSRHVEGPCEIVIRPECIRLTRTPPTDAIEGTSVWGGTIEELTDLGRLVQARIACARDLQIVVSIGWTEYQAAQWQVGEHACLAASPQDVHVLTAGQPN
jgi:ABC-type Fe3+/spermidine/putrescine transport system ATPase subunit